MNEMTNVLQEVESNPSIEAAVLISGKPGCFIAGADISMIEACKTKEEVVTLSKNGDLYLYIFYKLFNMYVLEISKLE